MEVTSHNMAAMRAPAPVLVPDPDTKLIGGRLKAILKERGLTLAWLAAQADISASQLSLLTRGLIRYPRLDTVRKITDALGISPGELEQLPDWRAGERPYEGIRVVPVVRLPLREDRAYVKQRGNRVVAVPESVAGGRERVLAAVIDAAGMSPHVMIGDEVIFDPDARLEDGAMVLLHKPGQTLAAWYVTTNGGPDGHALLLADGTRLVSAQYQVCGRILRIMREPTSFRPVAQL